MNRTPLAAASLLALLAPRAALAGDIGSTLVSILVPSVIFLTVLAIVLTAFYAGYKENKDRQETLRLAIEKGLPIPPELVEAVEKRSNPDRDLRRGVQQIFVGIGVGVLLWFVAPFKNVWAVGAMIAIFGLGHIVAWALTRKQARPATPTS